MSTTSLCEMNIHKSSAIVCGCIKLSIDMIRFFLPSARAFKWSGILTFKLEHAYITCVYLSNTNMMLRNFNLINYWYLFFNELSMSCMIIILGSHPFHFFVQGVLH